MLSLQSVPPASGRANSHLLPFSKLIWVMSPDQAITAQASPEIRSSL